MTRDKLLSRYFFVAFLLGTTLLFFGMFEKFRRHGLRVDAIGHVVVAFIAQDTDDFGGQRFIEQADGSLYISLVALGDGAVLNVLPGAAADLFDIT